MSGGWGGGGGGEGVVGVVLVRPRHKCPQGRLAHSATLTQADVPQSLLRPHRRREESDRLCKGQR